MPTSDTNQHSARVERIRVALGYLSVNWEDEWDRKEAALADLASLEEQHGALQQKYDALWQEQEHPFDKSEYDRLFEQYQAALDALRVADQAFAEVDDTPMPAKAAVMLGAAAAKVNQTLAAFDSNPALGTAVVPAWYQLRGQQDRGACGRQS